MKKLFGIIILVTLIIGATNTAFAQSKKKIKREIERQEGGIKGAHPDSLRNLLVENPSTPPTPSMAQRHKEEIGQTGPRRKRRINNTQDVERQRRRDEIRFAASNNSSNENNPNGYVFFRITDPYYNKRYHPNEEARYLIYETDKLGKKLIAGIEIEGEVREGEQRIIYLPDGHYRRTIIYRGKEWSDNFEVVRGVSRGTDDRGFSYEWRAGLTIHKM